VFACAGLEKSEATKANRESETASLFVNGKVFLERSQKSSTTLIPQNPCKKATHHPLNMGPLRSCDGKVEEGQNCKCTEIRFVCGVGGKEC